jgi:hypothetical protein
LAYFICVNGINKPQKQYLILNPVVLRKNKSEPRWIVVRTESNREAAKLFFYFEIEISEMQECIKIKYENCEQVPSICRLLVDADIDILEIYLTP